MVASITLSSTSFGSSLPECALNALSPVGFGIFLSCAARHGWLDVLGSAMSAIRCVCA